MCDLVKYRKGIEYLADNRESEVYLNEGDEHAKIVFSNLFRIAVSKVRIFAESLSSDVTDSDQYIESLCLFLSKGGNLDILLEREPSPGRILFEKLADFQDQVNVKITKYRPKLGHIEVNFCTVDDYAYRMETDKSKKKAYGSFFDRKTTKSFNTDFETMFNDSDKSIDFTTWKESATIAGR